MVSQQLEEAKLSPPDRKRPEPQRALGSERRRLEEKQSLETERKNGFKGSAVFKNLIGTS